MPRPKIRPRSYQQTCVRRVWRAFEAGAKTSLFIMAVGLGKTYTAAFLMKRWRSKVGGRMLVLCHQNDVNAQNAKSIRKVLGREVSFGYYNGDKKTTAPVDVLFASFQSIGKALEDFPPETFSLVLVDEGHHGVATTYRPVVEHFRPRHRVGMTGTIDRTDGVDVTELFGEPVFRMGIARGIAKKHLAEIDYRVELDNRQDWSEIKKHPEKVSLRSLNSRLFIPRRDEEVVQVIARHAREILRPKVKVFCATRKHCERIAELLTAAIPELAVSFVHSGLKRTQQRERLRAFKRGEIRVMVSVNKFQEGIDVPGINLLVFLRSTVSRIVFEQQLGRGLRRRARKTKVRVLDFVCSWKRLKLLAALERAVSKLGGDALTIHVADVRFSEIIQDLKEVLDAIDRWWTPQEILAALNGHRTKLPHPISFLRYVRARRQHHLHNVLPDFSTLRRHEQFLAQNGWVLEKLRRVWRNAEALAALEQQRDKLSRPLRWGQYDREVAAHGLTDLPSFEVLIRKKEYLASHGWVVEQLRGEWTAAEIVERLNKHSRHFSTPLVLGRYRKTVKRLKLEDMPGIEAIARHATTLKEHGWPVKKEGGNRLSGAALVQALERHRALFPDPLTSTGYQAAVERHQLTDLPSFTKIAKNAELLAKSGWQIDIVRPRTWGLDAVEAKLNAHRGLLPDPLFQVGYQRACKDHSLKMMPAFCTVKLHQTELEKRGWRFTPRRRR